MPPLVCTSTGNNCLMILPKPPNPNPQKLPIIDVQGQGIVQAPENMTQTRYFFFHLKSGRLVYFLFVLLIAWHVRLRRFAEGRGR